MKKCYTVFVLLFFTLSVAKAQVFPYYFSVETGATYTPLTDSVSLNNGAVWDDPTYIIPIGFDFDFYGFTTDSFHMEIGLGGILSPGTTDEDLQPLLIAYGSDIIDIGDTSGVSVSEISYKIEGSAGDRIAKIEWKNVGFYNEVAEFGTANNYLDFQLWLYEASGDIEVHFGPNNIEDDALVHDGIGPWVSMVNEYDYDLDEFGELWFLTGDQNNPTLDTIFTIDQIDTDLVGLDDDPSDGTIYRFSTSPPVSVINPIVDQNVLIYPAITNDYVNIRIDDIDLENANLVLFDASGKHLLKQSIQDNITVLNVQNLASGMYFMHINSSEGITTKKIIRQ